jgi:FkbM family methyltransferase
MAEQDAYGTYSPNATQRLLLALVRHSKLKRGAFRPMMSRLLGNNPIDTTYQGARFRLHHRYSGTERGALFNPDYNIDELNFLRAQTPKGGTFVDVGANVGTFAVVMALHVGEKGRVIAIEPHPTALARLKFNAGQLPFSNVTLVNAAAGDEEGELSIGTDESNLGASRIETSGIKVPSHLLATILAEVGAGKVDALKIDVEGYEDRVLIPFFRKADPVLWPAAVAIEHLERVGWAGDCIEDMVKRGYTIAGRTRSNTFLKKT